MAPKNIDKSLTSILCSVFGDICQMMNFKVRRLFVGVKKGYTTGSKETLYITVMKFYRQVT